jgi:deoxyadenosine/deoxycytidine kinase
VKKFIAIAGNMGAGKTSMVTFLVQNYGFEPVYEPFMDNPYLDDFYQDMKTWGFHSQLYFITHKFRLHRELTASPGTVVMDRTIYEDAEIFARNLAKTRCIGARDWSLYEELYQTMLKALQPPDLLVYLRCSVRSIRRRIKRRGRPSEQAIPAAYLRRLNVLYEDWIGRYKLSPVLIWDSDKDDYIENFCALAKFQRALRPFL